jgi:hypothetical protein
MTKDRKDQRKELRRKDVALRAWGGVTACGVSCMVRAVDDACFVKRLCMLTYIDTVGRTGEGMDVTDSI